MKKNPFLPFIIIFIGCLIFRIEAMGNKSETVVNSFETLKSLFKSPPVEYSTAPLWVWNDDVSEELIDEQLQDMKFGGIHGVFIHPRPGLITPYLSDRWFELCRYTVDKAKELDMEVWLYDENSYPSGFAGGHVPAEMPESYNQGQGLEMEEVNRLPVNAREKYYLVLKKVNSDFIDITSQLKEEENKEGHYYLFEKMYEKKSPWFGGFSYVDLLLEGVTEKFLEVTMTGYEKAIGHEFGKIVPGIFTDEPNIHAPGGIRWTPALFTEFQKRWGYDLKTNLPSLFIETGNWQRVRHNYYGLLLEMFIERWSKPYFNYCEDNDLIFTGHYWEHGWPDPRHGGDNMAMYAWHQMPAIDNLMNQYSEKVNAQFGNVRAVKELSSVANQMGRSRTLSETYGAGGWDLRFEDMKRIADWQYVLGVNFLNQHLSYITIQGARKRDHPQSFSYHDPWWKYYHVLGDYCARLSLALSSGKQVNRLLVLEPTTTAWMYYSTRNPHKKFSYIGPSFQDFSFELEKYQIEYDLGSENIIKDNGKIVEDKFVVGERSYDLLILPPGVENLDKPTADLVEKYLKNGGKILSFGDVPQYIDGSLSNNLKMLASQYPEQWVTVNSMEDDGILDLLASDRIQFNQPEKVSGILLHHRREFTDGDLLFLANTSIENWSTGSLVIKGKSAIELDPENGGSLPYPWKSKGHGIEIAYDLPPAGSLLLFVGNTPATQPVLDAPGAVKLVSSSDKMKIERTGPNTLTLDYCDLKLDGMIEKDIYFYKAADKIFEHHGFAGNPWGESVQYKTSILDRDNFSEDSGFEADFSFVVDKDVERSTLRAVIERPKLWKLSINGHLVTPDQKENWLDRAFGVYSIGKHVIAGKNILTINGSPMSVHSELEPVYILGDFDLQSQKKGWKLIPASEIAMGSWRAQGLPYYSEGVSYTKNYRIKSGHKKYILKLPLWYGCVAEVKINRKYAGIIGWSPAELDITDRITNGDNEISVIVYGTLKNLLGPHYNGPLRGSAWPSSFHSAPPNQPMGTDLDFIDYGLFDDFMIIEYDGPPQKVYYRNYQVSKPLIDVKNSLSIDSPAVIKMMTETENAEIRYTLDGSMPEKSSPLYAGPLILKQSTTLKTRAYKEDLMDSPVVEQSFYVLDSKKNGINYSYYEGVWNDLPDFQTLPALKKGRAYSFDLDKIDTRPEQYAFEFSGYLQIERGGEYTFYVISNDGSKLFIGNSEIVDNGGNHGNQEMQGKIALDPGVHPLRVTYFDSGGSQSLIVKYKGPDIPKQVIPSDKLMYRKP